LRCSAGLAARRDLRVQARQGRQGTLLDVAADWRREGLDVVRVDCRNLSPVSGTLPSPAAALGGC
jgi:hypothetical protein